MGAPRINERARTRERSSHAVSELTREHHTIRMPFLLLLTVTPPHEAADVHKGLARAATWQRWQLIWTLSMRGLPLVMHAGVWTVSV